MTPAGAGAIGYAARLGFGPLAVKASGTLRWNAGEPATRARTVLGGALPVASAAGVDWSSPALNIHGQWRPLGPGVPTEILFADATGRVEWTCHCPAARTALSIGGEPVEGLGYAERLVLTIPTGKLPLQELHWGRFIADAHSCVWIRWRGSVTRDWCFHNGAPVTLTVPESAELAWPGHRLQLAPGVTLRSGHVADDALNGTRWLRLLLPATVLRLEETKWCSPGTLTDAQGRPHAGWAVHEVVRFT